MNYMKIYRLDDCYSLVCQTMSTPSHTFQTATFCINGIGCKEMNYQHPHDVVVPFKYGKVIEKVVMQLDAMQFLDEEPLLREQLEELLVNEA